MVFFSDLLLTEYKHKNDIAHFESNDRYIKSLATDRTKELINLSEEEIKK